MFSKLRNKFILTNVITSAIIITMSFSSIYIGTMIAYNNRQPHDVPAEFDEVMGSEIEFIL